jgi:hypothetical protein
MVASERFERVLEPGHEPYTWVAVSSGLSRAIIDDAIGTVIGARAPIARLRPGAKAVEFSTDPTQTLGPGCPVEKEAGALRSKA